MHAQIARNVVGFARAVSVAFALWMLARGSAALAADNPSTKLTIVISPTGDAQSAPHGKGNVYAPDVLVDHSLYRMWFGGQGKDGHDRIQFAESQDGSTWQQRGVVLEDATANHVNDPSVVKRGDTYFMYYTRAATDIRDEIALATSTDGIHWTKRDVVLEPSAAGGWDSLLVGRPSVIVEGDRLRMWYDGRKDLPPGSPAPDNLKAAGSARAVGYAESRDGFHWTRPQPTPVFGENAGGVDVARIGNHYVMVYESAAGTQLAVSPDGLAWRPQGLFVPLSGSNLDRYGHVTPFLLLGDKATSASLFIGAARGGRWDENVIARIDLTPTQLDILRAR